jgi:flavin reductase (DIM6/NTAB) family NADH-FMN oxidoreductase RutF
MKKIIDPYDYLNEIVKGVKRGALITAKVGDKINPMTIGWGKIGIEWNRLIFTAYVRTGRYTHDMLIEAGEFTVNFEHGEKASKILGFCGSKSGKDYDKVKEMNLTLEEGDKIVTPGIKELPLTLECKLIYKQLQDKNELSDEMNAQFYPQDVPSSNPNGNKDYHTMFYGEIVGAYIVE